MSFMSNLYVQLMEWARQLKIDKSIEDLQLLWEQLYKEHKAAFDTVPTEDDMDNMFNEWCKKNSMERYK
jgi:hypothetical protein